MLKIGWFSDTVRIIGFCALVCVPTNSLLADAERKFVLNYAETVNNSKLLEDKGIFSYQFDYEYNVEFVGQQNNITINKVGNFIFSDERIRNEMVYEQKGGMANDIQKRNVIAILNNDYFAFNDNGEDIKKYELGPNRERNSTTSTMILAHLTDLNHYLNGFSYNQDEPTTFKDWLMSWDDLVESYIITDKNNIMKIRADTKYGKLYEVQFSEELNGSFLSLEMFESFSPESTNKIVVDRKFSYNENESESNHNLPSRIESTTYGSSGEINSINKIILSNFILNKEYDDSLFEFDSIDDEVKPNVPMIEVSFENVPKILDKNASGEWVPLNDRVPGAGRNSNQPIQSGPKLPTSNTPLIYGIGSALIFIALVCKFFLRKS